MKGYKMSQATQQRNNTTANGLPIIYRDFESIGHIDSIIKEIKELAEEKNKQYNDRVFIYTTNFNGHTINSSMSVDEIYQELFGCTKEELDKKHDDMDRDLENGAKKKNPSLSKSIQVYPSY